MPPTVSVFSIAVHNNFISPIGLLKPFLPAKVTEGKVVDPSSILLSSIWIVWPLSPDKFALATKLIPDGLAISYWVIYVIPNPSFSVDVKSKPSVTREPSNFALTFFSKVKLGTGGTVSPDCKSV